MHSFAYKECVLNNLSIFKKYNLESWYYIFMCKYVCVHTHIDVLQRPSIDPCTTLPITGYTINATVTYNNGSTRNYTSIHINDTLGGNVGRFNVSYNDIFEEELEPNATYSFNVITSSMIRSNDTSPSPSSSPSPRKYITTYVLYSMCI